MNELHRSLAEKILTYVRTSGLEIGHHLTEQSLQERFGASRPPIRAALNYLDELGVLEKRPNHGYFIKNLTAGTPEEEALNSTSEALYFQIADDRLSRILPDKVSENELMRRYDVSRIVLRRILMRISAEGWIERNEGRGWRFAALIDSVDAYRESYELRQVVEPYGLAATSFKYDKEVLSSLRRTQEMIRDGGWSTLTQSELVETNYRFHEGLAQLSGNRFVLGTVQKLNQLRRLVEYRQTRIKRQVEGQNTEHLAILDAIDDRNLKLAAKIMKDHLGGAKNQKARDDIFADASG